MNRCQAGTLQDAPSTTPGASETKDPGSDVTGKKDKGKKEKKVKKDKDGGGGADASVPAMTVAQPDTVEDMIDAWCTKLLADVGHSKQTVMRLKSVGFSSEWAP